MTQITTIITEIKCEEIWCLYSFTNLDDYKTHVDYHAKNNSKIINSILYYKRIITDNGIMITGLPYDLLNILSKKIYFRKN
jgi:hypothetical protein